MQSSNWVLETVNYADCEMTRYMCTPVQFLLAIGRVLFPDQKFLNTFVICR